MILIFPCAFQNSHTTDFILDLEPEFFNDGGFHGVDIENLLEIFICEQSERNISNFREIYTKKLPMDGREMWLSLKPLFVKPS